MDNLLLSAGSTLAADAHLGLELGELLLVHDGFFHLPGAGVAVPERRDRSGRGASPGTARGGERDGGRKGKETPQAFVFKQLLRQQDVQP